MKKSETNMVHIWKLKMHKKTFLMALVILLISLVFIFNFTFYVNTKYFSCGTKPVDVKVIYGDK